MSCPECGQITPMHKCPQFLFAKKHGLLKIKYFQMFGKGKKWPRLGNDKVIIDIVWCPFCGVKL